MEKTRLAEDLLDHLSLFQGLDQAFRKDLAHTAKQIRVEKGACIFEKGQQAKGLYVVVTGRVKLSIPSPTKREKVIEFIGPGQAVGEAVMFMDQPYLINAHALEDCMLLWIDKTRIVQAIESFPHFALNVISNLSSRFITLLHDIEVVNLQSAHQRVAGYLLSLPSDHGMVKLNSSKGNISSKLGLTAETFSRALQHLTHEGLIVVHASKVDILDMDRLTRVMQSGA